MEAVAQVSCKEEEEDETDEDRIQIRGREGVSQQMEGSLIARHLMHLFIIRLVSCHSAKGRNHAFITQVRV